MKIFTCSACKHVAFFENSQCTRCGHALAYLADRGVLSALEPDTEGAPGRYVALDPAAQGIRYRLCQNYTAYAVCNWAIPEHAPDDFCLACRLNETIPDLSGVALNSLSRSMGLADVYPFVLGEQVIAKLGFVHDLVEQGRRLAGDMAPVVRRAPPGRTPNAQEAQVNPA
jgi:hypothetical protein